MIRLAPFAAFCLLLSAPAVAQDSIEEEPATAAHIPTDVLGQARAAAARGDDAEALAHYLRALNTAPRDVAVLTGAGRTALALDDPESAIAFFARAEEVAPRDGRVKAGLGEAMIARRNPQAALRFFREAVSLGVPVADIAAARGLAYDLRGDGRRAQADYAVALAAHPDPETTRRLALSQAMTGQRETALATLDPLLRKQDIPAWRSRAFVYAVTGAPDEAEKAARQVMPRAQAEALSPYLARIAGLKPADQAAAVHLGYLPALPAGTRVATQIAERPALPPEPARPVIWAPPGRSLAVRPPAAAGSISATIPSAATNDPVAGAAGAPTTAFPPTGTTLAAAGVRAPAAATPIPPAAPAMTATATTSVPDATARTTPVVASMPAAGTPAAAITPERLRTSSARTASATPATTATRTDRPKADAKPSETKTAKTDKPKPAPPKEPERHWVQVAGGANVKDMPKAWAGLLKTHGSMLKGRQPWTMHYRFTNRLMVGPFADEDAAQEFVNKARKDGLGGFSVTSRAGEAVDRMAVR